MAEQAANISVVANDVMRTSRLSPEGDDVKARVVRKTLWYSAV
jgi:hypothetical protein